MWFFIKSFFWSGLVFLAEKKPFALISGVYAPPWRQSTPCAPRKADVRARPSTTDSGCLVSSAVQFARRPVLIRKPGMGGPVPTNLPEIVENSIDSHQKPHGAKPSCMVVRGRMSTPRRAGKLCDLTASGSTWSVVLAPVCRDSVFSFTLQGAERHPLSWTE